MTMADLKEADKEKASDADDDEDIVVVEESEDGDQKDSKESNKSESESDDDDDDDDSGSDQGSGTDDRERIRERRRLERKRQKQKQRERDERTQSFIKHLQRKLDRQQREINELKNRSTGHEAAQVDVHLSNARTYLARAQDVMKKALEEGDHESVIKAQDHIYEARKRVETLENLKKRTQSARPDAQSVDPEVVDNVRAFAGKHPWFNLRGGDEDSDIVKVIDRRLVAEGMDPALPEFWEELERRMAKRLPHRFKGRQDDGDDGDDDDGEAAESKTRVRVKTAGGSRTQGAQTRKVEFVLSRARKEAMIEAGIWDDPEARKKQIKTYMEYDRRNASRGGKR